MRTATLRLPDWFKQELPEIETQDRLGLLSKFKVNTVCQEARCPNLNNCFKNYELTFMILGDICTRNCGFCAVNKYNGKELNLEKDEPERICQAVKELGLRYVVLTSVTRDDLDDAGAGQFAETIRLIKSIGRDIKIEVLIPDFMGKFLSIKRVAESFPHVIAHNLETVRSLSGKLRPMSDYARSLEVLKTVKQINPLQITKSSLILGLGEAETEVIEAMTDLRGVQCDILTLGQYLAPSGLHYPVKEFIGMETFAKYADIARDSGFRAVLSGPLVRSSYKAQKVYEEISKKTTS